jgi:hypothetical protein
MTRPTDCPACEEAFLADPMMQAEAQHEAAKFGTAAGMTLADELLQEFHDSGHAEL